MKFAYICGYPVPIVTSLFLVLQPMKPMLPRKLMSSARVNLNLYWSVLEEMMAPRAAHSDDVDDDDATNAANENADNERLEAASRGRKA